MGGIVYEDEHVVVEEREAQRIVIVRRRPTRPEPLELVASFRAALAQNSEKHRDWGLIIDMREAPGRNDDAFRDDTAATTAAARRIFGCMVTLVGTAAGELHVRRISREDGREPLVARDEPTAISLCLQALAAAS